MDESEELIRLFERANLNFLRKNYMLFDTRVSERTLCGALMIELYEEIKNTKYSKYFVDIEYNRNNMQVKTISRFHNDKLEIIKINCDLIVHSRGKNIVQDNIIALEMKKSTARITEKLKDKIRLECLTKDLNDVWSYDGNVLPEHVCGYKLGIYYEIDFKFRKIKIEYYTNGKVLCNQEINYSDNFMYNSCQKCNL